MIHPLPRPYPLGPRSRVLGPPFGLSGVPPLPLRGPAQPLRGLAPPLRGPVQPLRGLAPCRPIRAKHLKRRFLDRKARFWQRGLRFVGRRNALERAMPSKRQAQRPFFAKIRWILPFLAASGGSFRVVASRTASDPLPKVPDSVQKSRNRVFCPLLLDPHRNLALPQTQNARVTTHDAGVLFVF